MKTLLSTGSLEQRTWAAVSTPSQLHAKATSWLPRASLVSPVHTLYTSCRVGILACLHCVWFVALSDMLSASKHSVKQIAAAVLCVAFWADSRDLKCPADAACVLCGCCVTNIVCTAEYVRHPMYCGLCFLTFGLCAITGSQARLALSVAFWVLLNYKASCKQMHGFSR